MDSVLINNLNLASSPCQCEDLKARRQKKERTPEGMACSHSLGLFLLKRVCCYRVDDTCLRRALRECAVTRVLPEKSLLWSQFLSVLLDSLTLLLRSVSTPLLGPRLTSPSPTPVSALERCPSALWKPSLVLRTHPLHCFLCHPA